MNIKEIIKVMNIDKSKKKHIAFLFLSGVDSKELASLLDVSRNRLTEIAKEGREEFFKEVLDKLYEQIGTYTLIKNISSDSVIIGDGTGKTLNRSVKRNIQFVKEMKKHNIEYHNINFQVLKDCREQMGKDAYTNLFEPVLKTFIYEEVFETGYKIE